MPMNDGNPFLNDYGTVVYPPRGKDNRHTRGDPTYPYVPTLREKKEEEDEST